MSSTYTDSRYFIKENREKIKANSSVLNSLSEEQIIDKEYYEACSEAEIIIAIKEWVNKINDSPIEALTISLEALQLNSNFKTQEIRERTAKTIYRMIELFYLLALNSSELNRIHEYIEKRISDLNKTRE